MRHLISNSSCGVRRNNPGSLNCWEPGVNLSKANFVKHVKTVLGFPNKDYAGRSFRIEELTLATADLGDPAIQPLGCLPSKDTYIRLDP